MSDPPKLALADLGNFYTTPTLNAQAAQLQCIFCKKQKKQATKEKSAADKDPEKSLYFLQSRQQNVRLNIFKECNSGSVYSHCMTKH